MHERMPVVYVGHATFALGISGDTPMQCDLSLLVTLQAAFINLSHTKASS